jgi:energy-converting hydrogenase Eha subunit C
MAWPRNPIYVLFLLALFRAGLITVAAHEKFLALSKGRQDSVGHSLAGAGL